MARKLIKFTPDEMGYKDRGKMKWQGLILSDHTEALKKETLTDLAGPPIAKELMSEEDIAAILLQAYIRKIPVAIQANELTNSHFYPDVICLVKGINDIELILELRNGRITTCKLGDIRNIEFYNVNKWYEK